MGGIQTIGLVVLILCAVVVASVLLRRYLLARTGSIDMCWRDRLRADGGGWYVGSGKFHGAELQLWRSISVFPVPNRRLRREDLTLLSRRPPAGTERDLLPRGSVITRCEIAGRPVELAMSPDTATGLLAWLEAIPPSNHATGRLRRTG